MNKTVTINISGIIFHIEEDAYESLSKYLSVIKRYFSSTEGGNEIMADIESRIAELLQQKLNAGKQVILLEDVMAVQELMGKPEDFGAEAEKTEEQQSAYREETVYNERIKRRLFRNPDEKAIGGVCSGLAAYFDVDTVWVRLAMFLLIFFGGLSLWVYIIMWIIIPEAKSTADRLAMKGEAANVNSIYKSFKEEAEDLKNRANKFGHSMREQNYGERVRSNAGIFLSNLFNVMGRLFGLVLVLIGGALLLAYLTSLTGITFVSSNSDLQHWKEVLFQSQGMYALSVLAFIVVIGVPVFMLLYAGVKLLFHIRYSNRWINLSLGIVWVMGLVLAAYVSVLTIRQFGENARTKDSVELHLPSDTIVVKMRSGLDLIKTLQADNSDDLENYLSKNHGGYAFAEFDKTLGILGYAKLNVSESSSDSVELVIHQSARGAAKKEANENARAITYHYEIKDNTLFLDELFSVEKGVKFRAQELELKLKLPKGKVVYFDKSVKYLLDDIDNTTNTWDGDMVSRRWMMTEKGLKCLDCKNLTSVRDHDEADDADKNIEINEDGIKVKDKESEIKIDKDGIRIKTEDGEKVIEN